MSPPRIECIAGPLDGHTLAMPDGKRCVFYSPPRNENTTYFTHFGLEEADVPVWERSRLTGRYYVAPGSTDARWFPY